MQVKAYSKALTCILPTGLAMPLVDALMHELKISSVNVRRGRGASQRSGTFADEVEILTAVVDADRADEVFAFIYDRARIGVEPHRFLFQAPLDMATAFALPQQIAETSD